MELFHLLTGLVEIIIAVLLWHHAAPALRRIGTWRAWMTWLLGLALALLGVEAAEAVSLWVAEQSTAIQEIINSLGGGAGL